MRWREITGRDPVEEVMNQPVEEAMTDPAKRAKAMKSLNKSLDAARKTERSATDEDDPAMAAAKRQQAKADTALAQAKFRKATTPKV